MISDTAGRSSHSYGKLTNEQGGIMAFGGNKARLDELERQVRRNTERLDDHEARLKDLERVQSTLDGFSGYMDMTRDELLRVQGALEVHDQMLEELIAWAGSEDYRKAVKSLRYRFRHHQTRCANALAARDG